jgi:hypothetical protein
LTNEFMAEATRAIGELSSLVQRQEAELNALRAAVMLLLMHSPQLPEISDGYMDMMDTVADGMIPAQLERYREAFTQLNAFITGTLARRS